MIVKVTEAKPPPETVMLPLREEPPEFAVTDEVRLLGPVPDRLVTPPCRVNQGVDPALSTEAVQLTPVPALTVNGIVLARLDGEAEEGLSDTAPLWLTVMGTVSDATTIFAVIERAAPVLFCAENVIVEVKLAPDPAVVPLDGVAVNQVTPDILQLAAAEVVN